LQQYHLHTFLKLTAFEERLFTTSMDQTLRLGDRITAPAVLLNLFAEPVLTTRLILVVVSIHCAGKQKRGVSLNICEWIFYQGFKLKCWRCFQWKLKYPV
jgi:hypothetical protein